MNTLDIIPVLDLMHGQVVHARAGNRDQYAPLQSKLAPDSAPATVLQGLLALHPFTRVYIADLDAIRGIGNNAEAIIALQHAFPQLEFWLDAGVRAAFDGCPASLAQVGRPVIGSESLPDHWPPPYFTRWHSDVILSLDFKGSQFLGPPWLWHQRSLWPRDLILMTLSRVGMQQGPAWQQLAQLQTRVPDRNIYAAGGVRHRGDLERLREMGVAGALLASSLHSGAVTGSDLAACC